MNKDKNGFKKYYQQFKIWVKEYLVFKVQINKISPKMENNEYFSTKNLMLTKSIYKTIKSTMYKHQKKYSKI